MGFLKIFVFVALQNFVAREPRMYKDFDNVEREGCPSCYEVFGVNEILYTGQSFCSVCGQRIKRKNEERIDEKIKYIERKIFEENL